MNSKNKKNQGRQENLAKEKEIVKEKHIKVSDFANTLMASYPIDRRKFSNKKLR